MRNYHVGFVCGAILVASIDGCSKPKAMVGSSAASQSGEAACASVIGRLPAGTSVLAIAGEYRLTLVATSGPRSGQGVSGNLKFDLPPRDTPTTTTSLTGTASIGLDAVGATAPGPNGGSQVTALQWASMIRNVSTPEITVRFGSISSPAGTRVIEGPHMALHLSTIIGDGFSGRWDSGTGVSPMGDAGGHFCANRVK